MNKIPYSKQWIDEADIKEVVKVLKSDWLTQGPKAEEFEKAVAKYCDAKYAVAFSSGTAALHGAYSVAGIKKGDEVITTPITFVATSNTIVHCGGKPVFVDVQENSLNIDPSKIEEKINNKTKAIAPVDFGGCPCDYDEIIALAKKYNLLIIEDACHALGAEYKGNKVGSFSDMVVLSFHPVKAITTGEGGMVLTNSKDFYEKLKTFRVHGIVKKPEVGGWYYEEEKPAFNYRLNDFQCALGVSQLKKLDKFIQRRREIAKKYNKAFNSLEEIILPKESNLVKSAFHLYPIRLKLEKLSSSRKEIFDAFHKNNILVQVHYIPLHFQPFYRERFGYKKGDFPNAEKYYETTISIPLFPKMTNQEVEYVIKKTKEIIKSFKK